MFRYIIGLAVASLFPGVIGTAHAQYGGTMADYMTMRVCTTTSDPASAVLQGVVPGDLNCPYSRQITAGETPPYTLRNFAANFVAAASPTCGAGFGEIVRYNVPVTINSVTHRTTLSLSNTTNQCASAQTIGANPGLLNVSVQDTSATSNYGFIMGSAGANGVTFNDAYQYFANGATTGGLPSTPICKTATPFSSARFANSWIVGQSPVSASLPGPIQVAVSQLQIIDPGAIAVLQAGSNFCSTPYVSSFHIWRPDWYMFYSGRSMVAMIASHYTQAAANNAGPGNAQAFERTYWTREFGLSRWEKWTRSDSLFNGQNPKTVSQQLLAHTTCAQVGGAAGTPYPIVTNPLDSHTSGGVVLSSVNGIYQKVISGGTTYTWYMTLCADYTNVDRSVTGQALPAIPSLYQALWAP